MLGSCDTSTGNGRRDLASPPCWPGWACGRGRSPRCGWRTSTGGPGRSPCRAGAGAAAPSVVVARCNRSGRGHGHDGSAVGRVRCGCGRNQRRGGACFRRPGAGMVAGTRSWRGRHWSRMQRGLRLVVPAFAAAWSMRAAAVSMRAWPCCMWGSARAARRESGRRPGQAGAAAAAGDALRRQCRGLDVAQDARLPAGQANSALSCAGWGQAAAGRSPLASPSCQSGWRRMCG